tara:strand:+ start:523 stop:1350 length:828 start_codon:yes stop_codon:yes gene_type:complete
MSNRFGYNSVRWIRQDWRYIIYSGPDGRGMKKFRFDPSCGKKGGVTASGKVRLCLPRQVIENLIKTREGRDALHEQIKRKLAAKRGQNVQYNPIVLAEFQRFQKADTFKDTPKGKAKAKPAPKPKAKPAPKKQRRRKGKASQQFLFDTDVVEASKEAIALMIDKRTTDRALSIIEDFNKNGQFTKAQLNKVMKLFNEKKRELIIRDIRREEFDNATARDILRIIVNAKRNPTKRIEKYFEQEQKLKTETLKQFLRDFDLPLFRLIEMYVDTWKKQ